MQDGSIDRGRRLEHPPPSSRSSASSIRRRHHGPLLRWAQPRSESQWSSNSRMRSSSTIILRLNEPARQNAVEGLRTSYDKSTTDRGGGGRRSHRRRRVPPLREDLPSLRLRFATPSLYRSDLVRKWRSAGVRRGCWGWVGGVEVVEGEKGRREVGKGQESWWLERLRAVTTATVGGRWRWSNDRGSVMELEVGWKKENKGIIGFSNNNKK